MPRDRLQDAFNECLKDAKYRAYWYVSLYEKVPFYGGSEEGGWWGSDDSVVAYEEFATEKDAEAACKAIEQLADGLVAEAKKTWQEHCSRQCDWLDARGLDADYLPETAGPTDYFVVVEREVGSHEKRGCRQYS